MIRRCCATTTTPYYSTTTSAIVAVLRRRLRLSRSSCCRRREFAHSSSPSASFSSHSGAAVRRKAVEKFGAPPSVSAVAADDDGRLVDELTALAAAAKRRRKDGGGKAVPGVAIRQVGCTRRVFLTEPYLTKDEIEGLAYRIRTLTRNGSINSVLVSSAISESTAGIDYDLLDGGGGTDGDEDDDAMSMSMSMLTLPSSLLERNSPYRYDESYDADAALFPPKPGYAWQVACGYDPLSLLPKGGGENDYNNADRGTTSVASELLERVRDLALAVRGNSAGGNGRADGGGGGRRQQPRNDWVSFRQHQQQHRQNASSNHRGAVGGGGGAASSSAATATTKVPVVTVLDGAVEDAGFAFCRASYVLATKEACFAVRNPSRGLSFDPVGLSYTLPRLGSEFGQPSGQYAPSCGMILGLTGYQADAEDMMETGLATNYVESSSILGELEMTLSEISPWNQQGLLKNPIKFHGHYQPPWDDHDHNAQFRNVAVADAVHCFTDYRADGTDMWDCRPTKDGEEVDASFIIGEDPSLETEYVPWDETRSSSLVDYASTFHDIFVTEKSVAGILERFREIAGRSAADADEQEGIDVAADFCSRIGKQSPLAVSVVHKLMLIGNRPGETLESCMDRELRVQAKLFGMHDYEAWARYTIKQQKKKRRKGGDDEDVSTQHQPFTGWKHRNLDEVTDDEVAELIGED